MTTRQGNTSSKPISEENQAKSREPLRGRLETLRSKAGTAGRHSREVFDPKNSPAARYIRENFERGDRLAIVVMNKKTGSVIQRLAPAEKIAAPDCQKWLRYMNESKYEVYISMNALQQDARGRTKEDIGTIRHVYLDLDEGGKEALDRLTVRPDLPRPNYVLNTSPGKYQVVWKVEGFTQEQAEILQRGLARETGADPAATDSSRVLRIPGFQSHKYEHPHLVEVEKLSEQVYRPEHFPQFPAVDRVERSVAAGSQEASPQARRPLGRITQSERDWAYARRALSRGDNKDAVIAAIASHRRFDKPKPHAYAARTVEKAYRSLQSKDRTMQVDSPQPQR